MSKEIQPTQFTYELYCNASSDDVSVEPETGLHYDSTN
jgi:hypothetical protein